MKATLGNGSASCPFERFDLVAAPCEVVIAFSDPTRDPVVDNLGH
jgi:hypothetical protein